MRLRLSGMRLLRLCVLRRAIVGARSRLVALRLRTIRLRAIVRLSRGTIVIAPAALPDDCCSAAADWAADDSAPDDYSAGADSVQAGCSVEPKDDHCRAAALPDGCCSAAADRLGCRLRTIIRLGLIRFRPVVRLSRRTIVPRGRLCRTVVVRLRLIRLRPVIRLRLTRFRPVVRLSRRTIIPRRRLCRTVVVRLRLIRLRPVVRLRWLVIRTIRLRRVRARAFVSSWRVSRPIRWLIGCGIGGLAAGPSHGGGRGLSRRSLLDHWMRRSGITYRTQFRHLLASNGLPGMRGQRLLPSCERHGRRRRSRLCDHLRDWLPQLEALPLGSPC